MIEELQLMAFLLWLPAVAAIIFRCWCLFL